MAQSPRYCAALSLPSPGGHWNAPAQAEKSLSWIALEKGQAEAQVADREMDMKAILAAAGAAVLASPFFAVHLLT